MAVLSISDPFSVLQRKLVVPLYPVLLRRPFDLTLNLEVTPATLIFDLKERTSKMVKYEWSSDQESEQLLKSPPWKKEEHPETVHLSARGGRHLI